jgi:hypothetical protein
MRDAIDLIGGVIDAFGFASDSQTLVSRRRGMAVALLRGAGARACQLHDAAIILDLREKKKPSHLSWAFFFFYLSSEYQIQRINVPNIFLIFDL